MILFVVLSSWLALPGRAQQPPPRERLAGLVEIARQRNPEILAARKNWETARARITAEKAWPAPEVGVEYWGVPRQSVSVGSAPEKWYDVSQTIPFPGKLALRGKSAAHKARREEEAYRAAEREVVAEVKEAYYGLLLAQRSARLYEDTADVLRRFAAVAESKYAAGKATQAGVLKAQVELSKTQNRALSSAQELETARARLDALLDRSEPGPLVVEEEPAIAGEEPPLADLDRSALDHRPEIRAAGHHVEHMKAELSAARADYLPDFTAQYTLRTRAGMPGDSVAVLKMTLPFVWFWRQNSIVKSTRFEKEHADAMLEAERLKARFEVREGLAAVQTARRLVELYRTTILPQTEQSLRAAESGYVSDRVGFLDLLDSERVFLDSTLEYYKAAADYGIAAARLERVLGADLVAGGGGEKIHGE